MGREGRTTMDDVRLSALRDFYKAQLLENCLPFWTARGPDHQHGGFFTCLDREGRIYNTDKSVWFQGRALWTYSRMCRAYGERPEWREAADLSRRFLMDHGFDEDGRMYFTVTADGRPLQKRRYMFSESFAVVGNAEYARAFGDREALDDARRVFATMLDLYAHPEKSTPKIDPRTRQTKGLAVPMILLATTQTLREASPASEHGRYENLAAGFATTVLNDFWKPEEHALLEVVGPHGERLDSPQGRSVNPGHAIETSWFLLHEAEAQRRDDWKKAALQILDDSLDWGWDPEHGGLLSFVDIEGRPPEPLEWDMKMWWPHSEALYATLLAYLTTGDEQYLAWFDKVHDYFFAHFADCEHGEFYGYLHRDGTPSTFLKGSMWKGPFHIPRALHLVEARLSAHLASAGAAGT
jgi:N-acylglucosamine 2-epimerase